MTTRHLWTGAIVLFAACAGAPMLRHAPAAERAPGLAAAAQASHAQTRVVVQAGEWPGEAEIEHEVTPLKLTIQNGRGERLRVTYGSFVLAGRKDTYAALPPFQIDGSVPTDARIDTPLWEQDGFVSAHYYGAYHSTLAFPSGPFGADPVYYRTYYPRWSSYERLPTQQMLAWALPEGIVEPGGSVTGFLYFEQVDADEREVQLRVHLSGERSGEVVTIAIPFTVSTS